MAQYTQTLMNSPELIIGRLHEIRVNIASTERNSRGSHQNVESGQLVGIRPIIHLTRNDGDLLDSRVLSIAVILELIDVQMDVHGRGRPALCGDGAGRARTTAPREGIHMSYCVFCVIARLVVTTVDPECPGGDDGQVRDEQADPVLQGPSHLVI